VWVADTRASPCEAAVPTAYDDGLVGPDALEQRTRIRIVQQTADPLVDHRIA
jgi:hypothetical protein